MTDPTAPDVDASTPTPIDTRALRRHLLLAGIGFVLLMSYTVVTLFTPWLDGTIGGVGIAYLVGYADFAMVLAIAAYYCIQANRKEADR